MKISQNTLDMLYREWSKRKNSDLKHVRFGQHFGNLFLKTEADSQIYYNESPQEAYALIKERYVDMVFDDMEDYIFQCLHANRVATMFETIWKQLEETLELSQFGFNIDNMKECLDQMCIIGVIQRVTHHDAECFQPIYWGSSQ